MRRLLMKNYAADIRGNFGIILAVVIVPLFIAIGATVDLSRLQLTRIKMQDAADAAVLTATTVYVQNNQKKYKKAGRQSFNLHGASISDLDVKRIKVKKTDSETIWLEAKATLDPIFVQMFGFPNLDVTVVSEAQIPQDFGLELAIAFDATNSMAFDARWDTAMTTVDALLEDVQVLAGREDFFVTLIPFQDLVNIGRDQEEWLTEDAPVGWNGCVEPREEPIGTFQWALDDDRADQEPFTAYGVGPESCPNVPITGPTSDLNEISVALRDMFAAGSGRFDVGMAWAWRTLSPNWRNQWDVPNYPENVSGPRKKYMVFMADGNTNAYLTSMSMEDDWGWNEGSRVGFEHFAELCRKVKADNIEIFFLRIEGNPNAQSYFEGCASSPHHFFTVNNADDVADAFGDILATLSANFRLVR